VKTLQDVLFSGFPALVVAVEERVSTPFMPVSGIQGMYKDGAPALAICYKYMCGQTLPRVGASFVMAEI
jgi:hypothetical protein